ncbi:MAG: hypothetical protein OQK73_01210 [Gammaproteobacteria bacterium]|nr:hypothetical protein [Gammaproteobacteria bacterium]
MPVLASGRVVGISNERARYHATRLNLKVTRDTTRHQLLKLVDIIVADPADSPDVWKKKYKFTGHTLADKSWIQQWPEEDREEFQHWLHQDLQCNEIDGAKAKLIYDNLPHQVISHDYPNQLHSNLKKQIEVLPLSQATAKQWLGTISNLSKSGIRKEEIHWSGITRFLSQYDNENESLISKKEIQNQIDFSSIRLEVTNEMVGDISGQLNFSETVERISIASLKHAGIHANAYDAAVLRYVDSRCQYRIGYLKSRRTTSSFKFTRWFIISPEGEGVSSDASDHLYGDHLEAIQAARLHANKHDRHNCPLSFSDKYKYVSLCGGCDYREWLVTLPDYALSYFSSHYTERNVLLHFRTKTRIDNKQNKLLFIEEIQSDWHQPAFIQSHNKRWGIQVPIAPFRKEWISLALKVMLLHAVKHNFSGIAWMTGELQKTHYQQSFHAVERLYDKSIPQSLNRLGKNWSTTTTYTSIKTRLSGLRAVRNGENWYAISKDGKFKTQARFNMADIIDVIERHGKEVDVDIPVFYISEDMRESIRRAGLPLFGEKMTS